MWIFRKMESFKTCTTCKEKKDDNCFKQNVILMDI